MTVEALAARIERATRERARLLRQYALTLSVEHIGSDPGFREALALFARYGVDIVRELEAIWEDNEDDAQSRAELGRQLLNHLQEALHRLDKRFSRAHQLHVPRALVSLVEAELSRLGTPRTPVLSVGPPSNYETFVDDLATFLYRGFMHVDTPQITPLALIVLPYMEGARTSWQPLVLGHEVAHLAALRESTLPNTDSWLEGVDTESLGFVPGHGPDQLRNLKERLSNWALEVFCDANVVRRYGPGGLASVADFLEAIGATDRVELTHPPGWLRVSLMLNMLGTSLLGEPWDTIISPWIDAASLADTQMDPWARTIADVLGTHLDEIMNAANALGPRYSTNDRRQSVEWISSRLAIGIPGGHRVGSSPEVMPDEPDVINAAWFASATAAPEVPVDSLAGKAIDTAEFLRLWSEAAGPADAELPDVSPATRGGVLSGGEIVARLDEQHPKPLIVTPLMHRAVREAGIDVRLASRFIVFRRSSTPAFSALDPKQDPRAMQRTIDIPWGSQLVLHPGELVLAATLEYVVLPDDLVAQVVTRSSYGRLGLVTATAVQVQPHFHGCLTLELLNLGMVPLALTPGERVAQLLFQTIDPPCPLPEQTYRFPVEPQFSLVERDWDLPHLRQLAINRGYLPQADTDSTDVILDSGRSITTPGDTLIPMSPGAEEDDNDPHHDS